MLRGGIRRDLCHDHIGDHDVLGDEQSNGEQEDGKDRVHSRAGGQDGEPSERPFVDERAGVVGVFRLVLAQHPHEAAQRQEVQRVVGVAVPKAEQAGRVAQPELEHLDATQLRHREVAQLMHDD